MIHFYVWQSSEYASASGDITITDSFQGYDPGHNILGL